MPEKGEEYESAWFRVEVDDETGRPSWGGGGAGDKERTEFGSGEPLVLDPAHFPPGTRIVVIEPWDEEFYGRLAQHR
jgi:hypothetical protein